MASEATIRSSLTIIKGNLQYRSFPDQYQATVTIGKGPVPGAFTAALIGTRVDLDELDTPGLCRIMNLDATNFVEVGIFDGVEFYPMLELLPGEFFVMRLSRFLGRSIGTGVIGTGTYDVGAYSLMVKATVAPCNVVVEAFDS